MKIENYMNRIKQIDGLIRTGCTGSPGELAEKVGLSESMIYNYINYMRDVGAPIAYSKKQKTYYYLYRVEFSYGFSAPESGP